MKESSRARLLLAILFGSLLPAAPVRAQRYGKGTIVLKTGESLEGEIREIQGGYEINLPGSKFGVPDPTVVVNYPRDEVEEVKWAGAVAAEAQLESPPGYEDIEELLRDPAQAPAALKQLDERTDDDRGLPDHHWMVSRAARLAGDTWRSATAFCLFRHLGGNEATTAEHAAWLKAEGAKFSQQSSDPAISGNPAQVAVLLATATACDNEILMKASSEATKSAASQLEALEVEAYLAKKDWHAAALRQAWFGTLSGSLEQASDVCEKILASKASRAIHWEAGALLTRTQADLEAVRLAEKEAGIPGEAEGVPPPEEGAPPVVEEAWTDAGSRYHDYSAATGTEAKPKAGELSGVRQSDLLALAGGKAKADSYRFEISNVEGDRWEFTLKGDEAKQILAGKPLTKKADAATGSSKDLVDITIFREK